MKSPMPSGSPTRGAPSSSTMKWRRSLSMLAVPSMRMLPRSRRRCALMPLAHPAELRPTADTVRTCSVPPTETSRFIMRGTAAASVDRRRSPRMRAAWRAVTRVKASPSSCRSVTRPRKRVTRMKTGPVVSAESMQYLMVPPWSPRPSRRIAADPNSLGSNSSRTSSIIRRASPTAPRNPSSPQASSIFACATAFILSTTRFFSSSLSSRSVSRCRATSSESSSSR
mmetsp:Transcript_3798/g.12066  ORF Transcript_3798/g.12066 Transcript_3798/m.12066 type:complete len:226 (+) Transcript_3798:153-830(+)